MVYKYGTSASFITLARTLTICFRYFRRNVQGILGPWATTRVGKILVLLVESGLIYCLIWAWLPPARQAFAHGAFLQAVYLVINITEGPNTLAVYGVITAAYHSIAVRLLFLYNALD